MREAFAHDAVLTMAPDADPRAPGAAITVALCGHWEHDPPCPLAPHHSHVDRVGDEVHMRILFAAEPEMENTVRHRIDQALAGGRLRGPHGVMTHWQLRRSQRSAVAQEETPQARRLTQS